MIYACQPLTRSERSFPAALSRLEITTVIGNGAFDCMDVDHVLRTWQKDSDPTPALMRSVIPPISKGQKMRARGAQQGRRTYPNWQYPSINGNYVRL